MNLVIAPLESDKTMAGKEALSPPLFIFQLQISNLNLILNLYFVSRIPRLLPII
jgi:hypothetical protein